MGKPASALLLQAEGTTSFSLPIHGVLWPQPSSLTREKRGFKQVDHQPHGLVESFIAQTRDDHCATKLAKYNIF